MTIEMCRHMIAKNERALEESKHAWEREAHQRAIAYYLEQASLASPASLHLEPEDVK